MPNFLLPRHCLEEATWSPGLRNHPKNVGEGGASSSLQDGIIDALKRSFERGHTSQGTNG